MHACTFISFLYNFTSMKIHCTIHHIQSSNGPSFVNKEEQEHIHVCVSVHRLGWCPHHPQCCLYIHSIAINIGISIGNSKAGTRGSCCKIESNELFRDFLHNHTYVDIVCIRFVYIWHVPHSSKYPSMAPWYLDPSCGRTSGPAQHPVGQWTSRSPGRWRRCTC